jgi:hypothetical protein
MTLSFFTSLKLTEAYHQETNGTGSLEQLAQSGIEIFPDAMRECAYLGRSIYQARLETGDLDLVPSATPRSGAMIPVPAGVEKSSRSVVAQRKERAQVRSSTDRLCC